MNTIKFLFDIHEKRIHAKWEISDELLKSKETFTPGEFIKKFKVEIIKIFEAEWNLWREENLESHSKEIIDFVLTSVMTLCITNESLRIRAVIDWHKIVIDWIMILWFNNN